MDAFQIFSAPTPGPADGSVGQLVVCCRPAGPSSRSRRWRKENKQILHLYDVPGKTRDVKIMVRVIISSNK